MTDLMASLTQSKVRWIDAVHNDKTIEERNEEEAQRAVNALRDNFYRKEE